MKNSKTLFQQLLLAVSLVALVGLAWRAYGWGGLALVAGGFVMWGLLHTTRMMMILQRAAHRPVGTVDSAVMLQARLHPGMSLLQVLALTRALGQRESAESVQPEVFAWRDGAGGVVRCNFEQGKLTKWDLVRS